MSLVLDASVAIAHAHTAEQTPAVLQVFDHILLSHAWVPALWHLEVANVFQASVRRKVYTVDTRDEYLVFLGELPVLIDDRTIHQAWSKTLQLAHRHHLYHYDATYLELAIRRSLPLTTLNKALRTAATFEGVPLLGL